MWMQQSRNDCQQQDAVSVCLTRVNTISPESDDETSDEEENGDDFNNTDDKWCLWYKKDL